ncbi:MAG: peptide deformylase [Candidatus Levybacteria bacterium]|nr:peptide deformylase [Candidatus Levybacteria bacterium]
MSNIVTAPDEVLSTPAKPYVFQKGLPAGRQGDKSLPVLLKNMEEALLGAHDPKGVGLAAPQIGKSLAIFMAKPTEKSRISVFINPKIVELEQDPNSPNIPNLPNRPKKRVRKLEGCLSLPTIWGEVKRAPEVSLQYQTPSGSLRTKKFTGFMAIIVQHEVDHLHGILFPRRVLEQKGKLYKSSKNEKGEDEFEEITI